MTGKLAVPCTESVPALTPQERRLRLFLRALALFFMVGVAVYLVPTATPLRTAFVELPFVTNSAVKMGTLAMLAAIAAADVRRFRVLITVIVLAHVVSELSVLGVLAWGDTGRVLSAAGRAIPVRTMLWASVALDGALLVLVVFLGRAADRARYALSYLSPTQYRTAVALADVLVIGPAEKLGPEEVARNVDRYLFKMRARSKWLAKVALLGIHYYPLLSLRAPFSLIESGARLEFIRKRFYQDVTTGLAPAFWKTLVQAMIRFGKQLSYLGYYNDPRTHRAVGYVPFSRRPPPAGEDPSTWQQKLAERRQAGRQPLKVETPAEVRTDVLSGDVVIVGSGAGASILAQALIGKGRSVLMLERGKHVDRSQFTEDEAEMLCELYSEGALQLSRDFRFQVIQGSCVGGSTVVNNAVCFDLPADVLRRWNDPHQLNAGLDETRLKASARAVRQLIGVERQPEQFLNPGSAKFWKGLASLKLDAPPNSAARVEANIHDCLGCGYCNIGCQFGAKLSMLDRVLPDAQKRAGTDGNGQLAIQSECEVLGLRGRGRRIEKLVCRLSDGRRLDVRGNTFVIAAGAISSSVLLLRSSVGGPNVGRRLAFNLGSPLSAVFDEKIDSYAGLQIAHFLKLEPDRGYVFETWWNPPGAQALAMPGWFEDHYRNMRRYDRMAGVGVLVGTESNGVVRGGGLTGRVIDYTPTPADLDKLLQGLMLAGEIFFAGGAKCVLPSTFQYYELRDMDAVRRLPELVKDASNITLGTGHPQSGNPLGKDRDRSVVDPEFRIWGYDNAFVCDASVFPSSIGVNPQLTVMTLAHYAADFVAAQKT
jgi:choline dehydrogenase-like flavoprotein